MHAPRLVAAFALDSSTETRRSRTPGGRGFGELAFTDPDGHVVVLRELD